MTAKRGRKLKPGAVRTGSGRISRASMNVDEMTNLEIKTACEAATWKRRQIDPTIDIHEARKQEYGSVIHAWAIRYKASREFTDMQRDALERFAEIDLEYRAVIEAKAMRSSSEIGRSGGYDGRDPFHADAARQHAKIERNYRAARHAVLKSGSLGMMAVETVVFENKDRPDFLADLRLAANALSLCFRWMDRS